MEHKLVMVKPKGDPSIRGGWEGANPAYFLTSDPMAYCDYCGRPFMITHLRVIHYLGDYPVLHGYEKDHLFVCKGCFENPRILPDWYGCGCGG